jgi:hypothetical protein
MRQVSGLLSASLMSPTLNNAELGYVRLTLAIMGDPVQILQPKGSERRHLVGQSTRSECGRDLTR